MRRHSLRIFLLISVLVILSSLVLVNREVDLPGDSLDRGGSGPLGLVLGLDLRGGAHLVYEAESPVQIDVTFENPISEERLRAGLSGMELGALAITSFTREEFSIDVPSLPQEGVDSFLQDLERDVGSIREFTTEREDRTRLDITLVDPPEQDAVSQAIADLGHANASVAAVLPHIFTVDGLPALDAETEQAMRDALESIHPLNALQTAPVEGEDDASQAIIYFIPLPEEGELETALDALGYSRARIVNVDGKTFSAYLPSLDAEALAAVDTGLRDELPVIEAVTSTDSEASLIDLTLETGLNQSDMETALVDQGFAEAVVVESRGTEYVVDLPVLDEARDLNVEGQVVESLGAVSLFQLQRDAPTEERMQGVIDTIERRVNAFGITEPSVQLFGADRVLVQLPGVEDTTIEVVFKVRQAQAAVETALRDLGFGDAIVDNAALVALPGIVDIRLANLSQEDQDRLRVGLEDGLGPLDAFSYNQSEGRAQVAFQQAVAQSDVTAALTELGFEGAEVLPGAGIFYRIRTRTLSGPEQDDLRRDLAEAVTAIDSFSATGGVEEAKALIGQTAQLVFKERTCLNADCSEFTDRDAVGRGGESLTGDNLVQAFAGARPTTGLPVVNFVFDGEGARIFRDMTTRISGDRSRCIAHILDDESIICPVVNQPIVSGAGFIEGPDFTFDRVRTLAIQLESGSLPIALDLVRESTVDSLLGDESLRASLNAAFVGLGLIILFMMVYYRAAGVVAAFALIIYAVLILAVFKMVPVTLTLSGLAGLILSIGMAVDANILIFERLKEELRAGRSLLSSVEIGFRRAWPAIRDSNTSTFITCGILFFFGRELGEPRITGFSITLAIGVAVSMFTALMVSRNLLQMVAFTGLGRLTHLFSPEGARRTPLAEERRDRQSWTS